MLLGALGVFGVLSLAVDRRRHELGARMAVGVTPGGVIGLVARYGLVLVATGSAIGIAAALAANRFIGSLLFQVDTFDPLVYPTVTIGLLAVAATAALAPASRVARVDPGVLRED